ncbi:MAG: amidohydrolase [Planctomycetota bacterium]
MLPVLLALAASVPCDPSLVQAPGRARAAPAASPDRGAGRATLYRNGTIELNDGRGTTAEALLSLDGWVVAVGTPEKLRAMPEGKNAQEIDLRRQTAVPGLQDAHGHVISYGASLEELDLRSCKTFEDLVKRVAARAATAKAGSWIVGRGWDQNLWPDKAFPVHTKLSAASPRNPVYLVRIDGHAALANRAALTLAKLEQEYRAEPHVQGGRVLLGPDSRPSGILVDRGMDLVSSLIPKPSRAEIESRILAAQEKLLAFGLTCVHDMGVTREELEVYEKLRASGRLSLRIVAYLAGTEELTDQMVEGLPLAPDARDVLSCPGVKLVADGALGSRGAALLADYADAPKERGHLILDERALSARIAICQKYGLQPAVHAIGDLANRTVLNVYETLLTVDPKAIELRPRVEHAQVVALRDWARFPSLGVIPSMQPVHAISDMPWAVDRLGIERSRGAYAWRALAPELGRLAFGSDFPVESPDPVAGLFAARMRSNPGDSPDEELSSDQSLDGIAALGGFTSGAAYAAHQDERRGRLLPGYATDMTVLTIDPVTCSPEDLRAARVTMTIINGAIVWRAQ